MNLPVLTNADARRLFLDRHLLLGPQSGLAKGADLDRVLTDLGFAEEKELRDALRETRRRTLSA